MRRLSAAAEAGLEFLIESGRLDIDALEQLGLLLQKFGSLSVSHSAPTRRRGRPPGRRAKKKSRKRGARGKLTATGAELKKMYVTDGMSAREIAEKYGVTPSAVSQRLARDGISKSRKGGARKKSGKKRAPSKRKVNKRGRKKKAKRKTAKAS